jgi:hypothetical protein
MRDLSGQSAELRKYVLAILENVQTANPAQLAI